MLPEEKPLSPAPAVELQLHTPTPQSRPHRHMSHSRFEPHRGTVARRQWHAFSWPESAQPGRVQEAMFHSSAVTGFSQHAKRDRHTHAHTRGKVERDPPSVSERRAGKVNVACVCTGLQNDRWSPGAIRQTNDGFIRTCHWQVMNAALTEPYLERDKNWEKRCEMLCRLFRRQLCFSFQVCAFRPH